ncbi:Putative major facilitator superfamily, MFS transporter superfamily [Septoria linicola]|uniref:Major facilitator superfamily, MFS transporter superfamily n=1 Tax=Septoria linicola TaxID=215465 RepID=A0A9Q9EG87_9PEZI|nr:Putative major facilitator superfamily, MFS transporter superfamily [Septoria linicola]
MTFRDAVRDSPAGILIRLIAPSSLPYPEELPGFTLHPSDRDVEKDPDTRDVGKTDMCGWYGEHDPENPKQWSSMKKIWVVANVLACAFVVYISGPIWAPSHVMFMTEFGTSYAYTSLGLAMFVLGYGVGPLLFAPLSEILRIGRNWPYILTFTAFVLITVPTALVRNAPAFMFLRFLQGFFGSPILATGGASIGDIYNAAWTPIVLSTWGAACFVAPVVGTIISAAAVTHLGWRFSIWETLIASVPVLVMMLFLPETSSDTILYYRAQRLRKATGSENIRSQSELNQHGMDVKTIVVDSLLVPSKITILDPAVLFINIYLCLIYGIYYSFFESFPIVYQGMYNFTLLGQGLAFLPLAVGTLFSVAGYLLFLCIYRVSEDVPPEQILIPAIIASIFPPIGLFLFGWGANPDIHWIVPMIGVALDPAGVFTIFQALLSYLAAYQPRFTASLFAASDFTRSSFAFAAILFARPMYLSLGIGGGCSLLAGLMVCCIFGLMAIYYYGPKLRNRSKFQASW